MFKHILVATDGSELSDKAVASAIALAAEHDAELVAFIVVPQYAHSLMMGALSFATDEVAQAESRSSGQAWTTLEAIVLRARASGVRVKTAAGRSDRPAEAIVSAARKHRSDLIIMASHARKGIRRLLMGSETQGVLTRSSVPVMVLC
jgi:nucleotide-binding universal stress UspA family protein